VGVNWSARFNGMLPCFYTRQLTVQMAAREVLRRIAAGELQIGPLALIGIDIDSFRVTPGIFCSVDLEVLLGRVSQ
jgi:hypothetical protein